MFYIKDTKYDELADTIELLINDDEVAEVYRVSPLLLTEDSPKSNFIVFIDGTGNRSNTCPKRDCN